MKRAFLYNQPGVWSKHMPVPYDTFENN